VGQSDDLADDPDPTDGDELTPAESFLGCFAVITLLFVPAASALAAIGFWQVGWPWAFGALAGLCGGATLCVIWYLLLKPR
jgi:hypothetical protein